mmetsp:Transcript_62106/g.138365  ORF Transcript_62106/g.138365 Transcript_62106/m.138365 type:complete len:100 (-) Transcript_62106:74-373(-)
MPGRAMSAPPAACAVCKARRVGLAPPKRKCSCDSGITSRRHSVSTMHSASRSSASRECIEIRVLGLPPDLVDTVDTHDFKEVELSSGEVVSVFDASDES